MIEGFKCAGCNSTSIAAKSQTFTSFPEVLTVQMRRFAFENWVPQKLSVALGGLQNENGFPAIIDLSKFETTGPSPDAKLLPEEKKAEEGEHADENIVAQLESMGFPKVKCERAAFETKNVGAEEAMNYLFAHMEDPSLEVPLKKKSAGGANKFAPELVVQLTSMGFGEAAALHALRECGGNVERSVDWLFSHPEAGEAPPPAEEQPAAVEKVEKEAEADTGPKKYQLQGFILHKGNQIGSGHYVAYLWSQEKEKWVLYDDESVCISEKPPIEQAYLYFFRRLK
jgi:ubiquitin carboxyl-terminal hydrolase 5/13